jgi:phage shock protein B
MGAVAPLFGVFMVFVAFPWIILHYVTQWKKSATLTLEDERLLDELHDLARRLDDRVCTVERIMTAENPNWRSLTCDPAATGIEDLRRTDNIETIRRER